MPQEAPQEFISKDPQLESQFQPRVLKAAGRDYTRAVPVSFTATAYDADLACTGKKQGDPAYGITASGAAARVGWTVAVDPSVIPLGSLLYIEGIGVRRADDIGSSIKGRRLDVFVATHEQALEFGVKELRVWLLTEVKPRLATGRDEKPTVGTAGTSRS